MRQVWADRLGIVDVAPLLWQGDLPGLPGRGAMFVRDLGPELNAELLAAYPDRRPFMLFTPAPDEPPALLPYEEGVRRIWGAADTAPENDRNSIRGAGTRRALANSATRPFFEQPRSSAPQVP